MDDAELECDNVLVCDRDSGSEKDDGLERVMGLELGSMLCDWYSEGIGK